MSFFDAPTSYQKKRSFRYELQDYMTEDFNFRSYSHCDVLEMGCGAGIDATEFARYGARVAALDFSDASLKASSELMKETGIKFTLIKRDLTKPLPFENDSFDVVYSFGVLHHIPRVTPVINEIYRVLRPEGIFMGMLYNKNSLMHAYMKTFLHRIETERRPGCPYAKLYTVETAKRLLRRFGQVQVSIRYNVIDLPDHRKTKFMFRRHVDFTEKVEDFHSEILGWHLIFKARKTVHNHQPDLSHQDSNQIHPSK
jgi:ubiquinone/menaquinone biosynthesis C-methylase UbiE